MHQHIRLSRHCQVESSCTAKVVVMAATSKCKQLQMQNKVGWQDPDLLNSTLPACCSRLVADQSCGSVRLVQYQDAYVLLLSCPKVSSSQHTSVVVAAIVLYQITLCESNDMCEVKSMQTSAGVQQCMHEFTLLIHCYQPSQFKSVHLQSLTVRFLSSMWCRVRAHKQTPSSHSLSQQLAGCRKNPVRPLMLALQRLHIP